MLTEREIPQAIRRPRSAPCPPVPPIVLDDVGPQLEPIQPRDAMVRRWIIVGIAAGALALMALGRSANREGVAGGWSSAIPSSMSSAVTAPSLMTERAERLSLTRAGNDGRGEPSSAGANAPGSNPPGSNASGSNAGPKESNGQDGNPGAVDAVDKSPRPGDGGSGEPTPLATADLPVLGTVTVDQPELPAVPEVPGGELPLPNLLETPEVPLP
jgi:hypothetical protein